MSKSTVPTAKDTITSAERSPTRLQSPLTLHSSQSRQRRYQIDAHQNDNHQQSEVEMLTLSTPNLRSRAKTPTKHTTKHTTNTTKTTNETNTRNTTTPRFDSIEKRYNDDDDVKDRSHHRSINHPHGILTPSQMNRKNASVANPRMSSLAEYSISFGEQNPLSSLQSPSRLHRPRSQIEKQRNESANPRMDESAEPNTQSSNQSRKTILKESNMAQSSLHTLALFLPYGLFQQFQRPEMLFFLLVTILNYVPELELTPPATAIAPFLSLVSTSLILYALEGRNRYLMDRLTNKRKLTVLVGGNDVLIDSKDLRKGDIVRILQGEKCPADMILISTSHAHGGCYLDTSFLYGSSELQLKRAHPFFNQGFVQSHSDPPFVQEETDSSDPRYYHAYLVTREGKHLVTEINLIPQGGIVRMTGWALGLVVGTGSMTKHRINSQPWFFQRSNLDVITNRIATFQIAVIISVSILLSVAALICEELVGDKHPATKFSRLGSTHAFFSSFGAYLVLLSYFLPMSLYICLDIRRIWSYKPWSSANSDSPNDQYTIRTESPKKLEDLALVEHVFLDKSVTEAEDKFSVTSFVMDGTVFKEDCQRGSLRRFIEDQVNTKNEVSYELGTLLLQALAVCHQAAPSFISSDEEVSYISSRADDIAALCFAKDSGRVLVQSTDSGMLFFDQKSSSMETIEVLELLQHTPERRVVSVIFRDESGSIIIFSKGDANAISPLLESDQVVVMQKDLDVAKSQNHNILVYGYRRIPIIEYESWRAAVDTLTRTSNRRSEGAAKVYYSIESKLSYLSMISLAMNCKEGAVELVQDLRLANIPIWLLSEADFESTLQTINTLQMIKETTEVILIDATTSEHCRELLEEQLDRMYDENNNLISNAPLCLLIGGETLSFALKDQAAQFLELALICKSVVCYDTYPLQKALVVSLVRHGKGRICLAIGPGGSDSVVYQSADVSIGICRRNDSDDFSGADFAVQKLKYPHINANHLLFAKGRRSYIQYQKMVYFSIYKSGLIAYTQVFYSFSNMFSAQSIHHPWLLVSFNSLFTLFGTLLLGFLDKDIPDHVAMKSPQLLRYTRVDDSFGLLRYGSAMAFSALHSLVALWFALSIYGDSVAPDGKPSSIWEVSIFLTTMLAAYSWCAFAIFSSITRSRKKLLLLVHAGLFLVCNLIYASAWDYPHDLDSVYYRLLQDPRYWFGLPVGCIASFAPILFFASNQQLSRPTNQRILLESFLHSLSS